MSWEEFFDAYQSARCAGDRQVTERIIKDARSLLSKAPMEDWKLLGAASTIKSASGSWLKFFPKRQSRKDSSTSCCVRRFTRSIRASIVTLSNRASPLSVIEP